MTTARSPRFQAVVWICAIVLADFIVAYNVTYAVSEIGFQSFLLGNIISSFILIITFGIVEFYKSSYFSGFPYINRRASSSLSYMKKTFCFWIVGKLISQSVCIFLIVYSKIEDEDLGAFMKGKTLMGFMLYFIYGFELFLTEIMPGRLVLNRKYLQIFEGVTGASTSGDMLDSTSIGISPDPNTLLGSSDSGNRSSSSNKQAKRRASIKLMRFDQLNLPDHPNYSKKHGFGPIYFGEVENQKLRVRQLKINDVSTFQLREIPAEIKKWKKLNLPSVESYLGEYHQTEQYYYIMSEANEQMYSLASMMYDEEQAISKVQKDFVCKNLVKTLVQLEAMGDEYSHGHLCPNNILVDLSNKIDEGFNKLIIQDFGFCSLKAYVSMLSDYSNKDQYTAPEQLKQKGKVVKKATHKSDVYAFAFLL